MRVCLLTIFTPASENINGTSALPYHLLKDRMDDVDVFVYSFNANNLSGSKITEVEKELNVEIKIVPLPTWFVWLFRLRLLFLRVFMPFPLHHYIKLHKKWVDEIKCKKVDLIWVYGEELSCIVKQFPDYRRVHLGPDTESLYYYRMMGRRFVMNNALEYWKCALMFRKYARMERAFCTDENFTYYAVGEEDVRHLQQINPKVKANFLRHPHYEVRQHFVNDNVNANDNRKFHQPKIKVLIAGRYDLYMKQTADELFEELKNGRMEELKSHFSYTFLGKGWEKHVETLRKAGYEVEHITFAPDYIEEICKHDIQITPIAIGTGTKGKVLDALANGLLVIGTPYAMENIAVENGVSCIEYRHPQEVIKTLLDIPKDIQKYEEMAAEGQRQVLMRHNRRQISEELFGHLG